MKPHLILSQLWILFVKPSESLETPY